MLLFYPAVVPAAIGVGKLMGILFGIGAGGAAIAGSRRGSSGAPPSPPLDANGQVMQIDQFTGLPQENIDEIWGLDSPEGYSPGGGSYTDANLQIPVWAADRLRAMGFSANHDWLNGGSWSRSPLLDRWAEVMAALRMPWGQGPGDTTAPQQPTDEGTPPEDWTPEGDPIWRAEGTASVPETSNAPAPDYSNFPIPPIVSDLGALLAGATPPVLTPSTPAPPAYNPSPIVPDFSTTVYGTPLESPTPAPPGTPGTAPTPNPPNGPSFFPSFPDIPTQGLPVTPPFVGMPLPTPPMQNGVPVVAPVQPQSPTQTSSGSSGGPGAFGIMGGTSAAIAPFLQLTPPELTQSIFGAPATGPQKRPLTLAEILLGGQNA